MSQSRTAHKPSPISLVPPPPTADSPASSNVSSLLHPRADDRDDSAGPPSTPPLPTPPSGSSDAASEDRRGQRGAVPSLPRPAHRRAGDSADSFAEKARRRDADGEHEDDDFDEDEDHDDASVLEEDPVDMANWAGQASIKGRDEVVRMILLTFAAIGIT